MDYIYPVPFVMAWLLCLLIFLERRQMWMLFIATSFLGIGFYTYIASVVMMPLYLLLTAAALSGIGPRPARIYAVAAAGFIWPLLILIPWAAHHADALMATAGRYQLANLPALAVTGAGSAGFDAGGVASVAGILRELLGLLIFLERRRPGILFAATSILGIGCYSYIASLVMMPVYLGLTWCVLSGTIPQPRRLQVIGAAGFIWPLVIIAPWLLYHSDALAATSGRYQLSNLPSLAVTGAARTGSNAGGAGAPVSNILSDLRQATHFSGVTGRVSLYWYFFDPSYLFLSGGYANVINSTRRVGVFLLPLAFLIPIGLHQFVNVRRSRLSLLLVLGFLSAPLAACLVVPEPYAVDRELEILPFAVLLATAGADSLLSEPLRGLRIAGAGLLTLVPLHFAFFCFDYFGDYRARSAFWFEGNRRGALEDVIAREPRDNAAAVYLSKDIPYIDAYWRFYVIKHGRQDLLQGTVYFEPANLNPDTVPGGSLLVTNATDRSIETLVNAGKLRTLAMIPEPGAPPMFAVFGR
jgi:hypothetical protein